MSVPAKSGVIWPSSESEKLFRCNAIVHSNSDLYRVASTRAVVERSSSTSRTIRTRSCFRYGLLRRGKLSASSVSLNRMPGKPDVIIIFKLG